MKAFRSIAIIFFVVLMITFSGTSRASTWNLNKPQAQSSGKKTSFVVNADFNGDGIMDLASCTRLSPGKVSIFLGKGDGKFTKKVTFTTGKKPVSMSAGDFNGDGMMDLAVVNWGDNTDGTTPPANPGNVIVYLGKGDGTFKTGIEDPNSGFSYLVGTNPVYIVSADFNGDGNTDLAVANWESDSVSVLLGNGDGSFPLVPVNTGVGTHPRSLAVGDIEKDGNLDLVVANWSNDTVSLLHGDGTGNFSVPTAADTFDTGKNPTSVALGDLNSDGWLDIVASNFDADNISMLLSDGTGGFKPVEFVAAGSGPSFVVVKDIDGDGNEDIITSSGMGNNMSLFLGLGDGTLQSRKDFTVGSDPVAAVVTDFNNNGGWDLAVANFNTGSISVFKDKNTKVGDWTFLTGPINSTASTPTSVFATDLNRDDVNDIVATDGNGVYILLNDGKGVMTALAPLTAGTAPVAAVAADFTGDGIKDIAVANSGSNTISIFKGKGHGTYDTPSAIATGNTPVSVISGDFNKDGKMDLAVCNSADNNVQIFHGDGTGAFTTASTDLYTVGITPLKVVTGDFNGDGKLDLAVANQGSGTVSILLGDGLGAFTKTSVDTPVGSSPISLAAEDFNADKRVDLAVANQGSNDVSILINNGSGTFKTGTPITIGTPPTSIAAGDLNLDKKPDLVVTSGNTVYTYFGKGTGLFDTASPTVPIGGAGPVVISEFNMDGKADLAVASSTGPGIYIVKGIDQFHITTSVTGSGSVSPGTGDYEGGKVLLLKATAASANHFKNWSDGISGSDNPRAQLVLAAIKDKTITANFESGPYISSLDSYQGVLKDSITISGSNFGLTKGTVSIGSTNATIDTWADGAITFKVPANIASNKYKLHVTAGGKKSSDVYFYILKAFIASSDHATASKGDSVILTGVNFGPDKVTVALYPIDGISGTNATVTSSPSNTSVTITVPGVAAGDYIMKVKNTHGYSNGFPITVN